MYNETVYQIDKRTGEVIAMFVAQVDANGTMLRSKWLQFTGLEGSPRYDAYPPLCGC